jgi:hypothetical protein
LLHVDLFGQSSLREEDDGWDHYKAARAGELLAAFELAMLGVNVTIASEGRPYDLIADVSGKLMRVQVKTATLPKDHGRYIFSLVRGSHKATSKSYAYCPMKDADIFALAALDRRAVAFVSVEAMVGITKLTLSPNQFMADAAAASFRALIG